MTSTLGEPSAPSPIPGGEQYVSSAGPGWKFADLIIRVARFARHPQLTLEPVEGHVLAFSLRMAVLQIVIGIGVIWMTLLGTDLLGVTDFALDDEALEDSPWGLLFLAVIVAPLTEEAAMRLLVHPWSAWRFWVSVVLWFAFGASLVFFDSSPIGWMIWLWPVGLAVWRVTHRREQAENLWNSHPGVVVWMSTLGFGLAHISNYTFPLDWRLIAAFVLVMPQILGGILLAYSRVRGGFWAGVLQHGFANFLLLGPAVLATT